MDPLSITAACVSLIATITKTSISVSTFVRTVRAARSDLDAVSRELASLKTLLELIAEDAADVGTFPDTLRKHISGILSNCGLVLVEVQRLIDKYHGPGVIKGSKWAVVGSEDVGKLILSLEAHKSALEIALEMVTLSLTREIKADTSNLRDDTAAIKQDTAAILEEISRLRAQLPDDLTTLRPWTPAPDAMLLRYLDDLSSYAETVCWSGEDSDTDAGNTDEADARLLSDRQNLLSTIGRSTIKEDTSFSTIRQLYQTQTAPLHLPKGGRVPASTWFPRLRIHSSWDLRREKPEVMILLLLSVACTHL
ncbi:Nn.00g023990.m01.CDS01 [Neocucurbitaria sp. VM-36]